MMRANYRHKFNEKIHVNQSKLFLLGDRLNHLPDLKAKYLHTLVFLVFQEFNILRGEKCNLVIIQLCVISFNPCYEN